MDGLTNAISFLTSPDLVADDIEEYAKDRAWWLEALKRIMGDKARTKVENEYLKLVEEDNIIYRLFIAEDPVGYCLSLFKKLNIKFFDEPLALALINTAEKICYFKNPKRTIYVPLRIGFDLTKEDIEKNKRGIEEGIQAYFEEMDYIKAFNIFQGEASNPLSQFILGHLYENGCGEIKVNSSKAKELYEQSTGQGFLPSKLKLGEFYLLGRVVLPDWDLGFKLCEEAKEMKLPASYDFLSSFYFQIGKLRKSYSIAKEGIKNGSYDCYRVAFQTTPYQTYKHIKKLVDEGREKGNHYCMFVYDMREKDKSQKPEDRIKEIERLLSDHPTLIDRKFFESVLIAKYVDLAKYSQDKKLIEKTKRVLQEAMEDRVQKSFLEYADFLLLSEGYFPYYLKGAYCGHEVCIGFVASAYYNGYDGVKKDYEKAAFWAEIGALYDNTQCMVIKGNLLIAGICYEKNVKAGVYLLQEAAEEGENLAYYYLGVLTFRKYIPGGNKKAYQYLENGYKHGEINCTIEYAKMNLRKMTDKCDPKKGYDILLKLANEGNGAAQMELGMSFWNGKYLAKDETIARKYLDMAKRNKEFPLAQRASDAFLGLTYYYGSNEDQPDDEKALESLQKAFDKGDMYVCEELGNLYFNKKDYEKAKFYFQKGVEVGIPDCCISLGHMYWDGYGGVKDLKKSEELYKKAIELGDKYGYYWLARVYMEMDLKKTDGKRIMDLLRKASQHNVPEAFNCLGTIYKNGDYLKKPNMEKALDFFKKASAEGIAGAQFSLGSYLLDQKDPKLREEGFQWMYQLAKKENPYAMLVLIECYIFSEDEDKKDMAFEWIQKVEKLIPNNPYVDFFYGYCYMFGYGVMEDQVKAIEYLKRSAYQDDPLSCFILGQAYRYSTEIPHDPDLYFLWVKKAYELNPNASASTELGKAYEEGYGTKQDFEKAKECFTSGVKRGSITSYEHLKRLCKGKLPEDIQSVWDKIPEDERVDDKMGIDAIDVSLKDEG